MKTKKYRAKSLASFTIHCIHILEQAQKAGLSQKAVSLLEQAEGRVRRNPDCPNGEINLSDALDWLKMMIGDDEEAISFLDSFQ